MKPSTTSLVAIAAVAATALAGCAGGASVPAPTRSAGSGATLPSTTSASAAPSTTGRSVTAPAPPPAPAPPVATESNPPGDIPDNQAYVEFMPSGSTVAIKVPEGWARSVVGRATTFTDKLNRIEISTSAASKAPSPESVSNADVSVLRSSVPRFVLGAVTKTTRTAGSVILLTYQGDSTPNPVTGKVVRDAFERYVYYRAGTRADVTLSGPTNADNVDPWRTVSDSVRFTP